MKAIVGQIIFNACTIALSYLTKDLLDLRFAQDAPVLAFVHKEFKLFLWS